MSRPTTLDGLPTMRPDTAFSFHFEGRHLGTAFRGAFAMTALPYSRTTPSPNENHPPPSLAPYTTDDEASPPTADAERFTNQIHEESSPLICSYKR